MSFLRDSVFLTQQQAIVSLQPFLQPNEIASYSTVNSQARAKILTTILNWRG